MKMNKILAGVLLGISLFGCYQSDPPMLNTNTDDFGRVGDSVRFAGRDWKVKIYENQKWGPGPNYFSGNPNDIYLDENGYLHMKIVQRNGEWYSTEIVSDEAMGYGRYTFTVEGDMEDLASNTVLGLFTWDDETFKTDANSEVDVEISRWGNSSDPYVLQFGVQPIFFGQLNEERMERPEYSIGKMNGLTNHTFIWTDSLITWESYVGDTYGQGEILGTWRFDLTNPARVKEEGGNSSDPVIIPAPGDATNARINLWLHQQPSSAPANGLPQEVIIRDFEYEPFD